MLILSQNGKYLCNLDTIKGLYICQEQGQWIIKADTNGDESGITTLAKYSSEEAAVSDLGKIAHQSCWNKLCVLRQKQGEQP